MSNTPFVVGGFEEDSHLQDNGCFSVLETAVG